MIEMGRVMEKLNEIDFEDTVLSITFEKGEWVNYWNGFRISDKDLLVVLNETKAKMIEKINEDKRSKVDGGDDQLEALVSLYSKDKKRRGNAYTLLNKRRVL